MGVSVKAIKALQGVWCAPRAFGMLSSGLGFSRGHLGCQGVRYASAATAVPLSTAPSSVAG